MTLKNNRAPLLSNIQALCNIYHVNSNWSYSPETAKLGVDRCDFCMDVTSVIGNNSRKFHDGNIVKKV